MSASSLGKRPRQNLAPATKLADANNTEQAGPSFQQKSDFDYRAAQDAPTGTSSEILDATSRATSTMTTQISDTASSRETSGRFPDKRPFFAVDSDDSDTTPVTGAKSTDHPRKKKGSWFRT